MGNNFRHFYEFGPFRLDPKKRRLMRDGEVVSLPPKALEALLVLVRNPGKPLEREALMEAVWADSFVEDANLTVAISHLRKALGQNGESTEYVETVPRVGYRFVADVREVHEEPVPLIIEKHTLSQTVIEEDLVQTYSPTSEKIVTPQTQPRAQLRKSVRLPLVLTVVAVFLALGGGGILISRGWRPFGNSASGQKRAAVVNGTKARSLAILPFRSIAQDDHGARMTNSAGELTDGVIARLGSEETVKLTPQGEVLAAKMAPNNLLLAGHTLTADAVLTGALFQSDPQDIYVRLHLVSVNGGEVLWADTFKQPRNDLPSLLDSIARGVKEGLQRLESAEEYERRAGRHTTSREAYQHYLQGRFLWEQRHDVFNPSFFGGETVTSLNQLEQAVALDQNFALAYVGLADHYKTLDYHSKEGQRGEEYARRAIALDPTLAEAHATLAFVRMFQYWDWQGAETEFKLALAQNPNCVTAHQWYALFYALRGNVVEALTEITHARELAPYSLSIMIDEAEIRFYERNTDVIIKLRRLLTLQPHSPQIRDSLINAYWFHGAFEKATEIGDWSGSPQDFALRQAGLSNGRQDINKLPPVVSYWYARWHAQLNNRELALDLLEKAYREHDFFIIYLRAEPFFDNLRDEPRFKALLDHVGLPG